MSPQSFDPDSALANLRLRWVGLALALTLMVAAGSAWLFTAWQPVYAFRWSALAAVVVADNAPPIVKQAYRSPSQVHIVKAGETEYGIARRYGVRVDDLKRWNQYGTLQPGQRLVIQTPVRKPYKGRPVARDAKGKPKQQADKKVKKTAS